MTKTNATNSPWNRLVARGILIVIASLLLASVGLAQEVESLAAVIKTTGSVDWLRKGSEEWAAAEAGLVLDSGDRLRTGAGGGVAVMFLDDRSLLKLAEKTDVTFQASREGGAVSTRIWMGAGQLWAKVTKAADPHFRVETPTSVAAVKGSEFYDIEDGARGNTFHALTGTYSYGNDFGSIELRGGQTGESDGNSPPTSRPTQPGELPGFGGGLGAYGGKTR